jgi:hypothetical protein
VQGNKKTQDKQVVVIKRELFSVVLVGMFIKSMSSWVLLLTDPRWYNENRGLKNLLFT